MAIRRHAVFKNKPTCSLEAAAIQIDIFPLKCPTCRYLEMRKVAQQMELPFARNPLHRVEIVSEEVLRQRKPLFAGLRKDVPGQG